MLLTILAVTAATTVYLEKTHGVGVGNFFQQYSFFQNACACDTTTTESTRTTAAAVAAVVTDLIDNDTIEHDLLLLTAVETSSSFSSDSSG